MSTGVTPQKAQQRTALLSALVRNYGEYCKALSGMIEPLVLDFREESSQIFASEGPLKGRSSYRC